MTHGSITHHFGTAANLQAAVADVLIEQLLAGVRSGACALKAGTIDEAALVDLVFDVFEEPASADLSVSSRPQAARFCGHYSSD